ncbi:MAG: hypothetical protein HOP29_09455 [Phycisphaerales bacterium]|nr:hypothetical protein [Phycisphaerales bacterium]
MNPIDIISILIVAAVCVAALRAGAQLATACGVDEPAARWALAWISPNAVVIVGVHVVGLTGLIVDRAILTLPIIAVAVVVAFTVGHAAARRMIGDHLPFVRPQGLPAEGDGLGSLWWAVAALGGVYAVFLIDAATRYPTGYDGTHYHLPAAIGWMQARAMHLSPGVPHYSSPENGMIGVLLLSYLRLEKLITLVNMPYAAALGCTVYALARATGAGRRGAAAATCVAMSAPMVVFQSVSGYVDVFAAQFYLAALLAVVHAGRAATDRQRNGLMTLAGIACGIALGSRISYLAAAPPLVVIVVVAARTGFGGVRNGALPIVGAVTRFGTGILVCSGFWFARGAIEAGNPFYPLEIKAAGRVLLPGVDPGACFPERSVGATAAYCAGYPWHESKRGGGYAYGVDNGTGAACAVFVPVGMLAALWGGVRRRSTDSTNAWSWWFAALAIVGFVLLATVFYGVVRYALPFVLVGACAAAPMMDRLVQSYRRRVTVLLTLTVAVGGSAAALKPAHALMGRIRDGRWSRSAFYEVPAMIGELPPESRIAVISESATPLCYALLGGDYSNRIYSPAHVKQVLGDGMTRDALLNGPFDYLFVREPWPADWPVDLPVSIVYDDINSRTNRTTPATRVYRVDR